MTFKVLKLTPSEWAKLSSSAHILAFHERRDQALDRIDFALLAVDTAKGHPVAYATVRELDSESCYWQYGGAFPDIRQTLAVARIYRMFLEACSNYQRVTTLVDNQNVRYLKLAMAHGFRIIGTRFFKGGVYVELHIELPTAALVSGRERVCQA